MNFEHLTDAERAEHKRVADEQWRAMGGEVWSAMKQRCYNPKNAEYPRYGACGIKVCSQWRRSFAAFFADMGPPPVGYSLDRYPNNDGDYEPQNCRWATAQEQADNRRDTILIHGKPLSFWADKTGITKGTIDMRLRRGWSVERALSVIGDTNAVA